MPSKLTAATGSTLNVLTFKVYAVIYVLKTLKTWNCDDWNLFSLNILMFWVFCDQFLKQPELIHLF